MANVVFSVCAGIASTAVAVLAGLDGAYVVTAVWAALAVGFAARAGYGWRRLRRASVEVEPGASPRRAAPRAPPRYIRRKRSGH